MINYGEETIERTNLFQKSTFENPFGCRLASLFLEIESHYSFGRGRDTRVVTRVIGGESRDENLGLRLCEVRHKMLHLVLVRHVVNEVLLAPDQLDGSRVGVVIYR